MASRAIDDRAIAGLSMGGEQALSVGLNHLDIFHTVAPLLAKHDIRHTFAPSEEGHVWAQLAELPRRLRAATLPLIPTSPILRNTFVM
jgi:enterochelin esterase-like enzyme